MKAEFSQAEVERAVNALKATEKPDLWFVFSHFVRSGRIFRPNLEIDAILCALIEETKNIAGQPDRDIINKLKQQIADMYVPPLPQFTTSHMLSALKWVEKKSPGLARRVKTNAIINKSIAWEDHPPDDVKEHHLLMKLASEAPLSTTADLTRQDHNRFAVHFFEWLMQYSGV